MDLPTFRYHPDPIASGSIAPSDARCACCDPRRGFIYKAAVYCLEALDEALCPWCIADGSAHARFDATFADDAWFTKDIPQEVIDEVCHRTPAFDSWQSERWLTCCGDAAIFLEPVGQAELRARYPEFEDALIAHLINERNRSVEAAVDIVRTLDRDHGPTGYLFVCHCDS